MAFESMKRLSSSIYGRRRSNQGECVLSSSSNYFLWFVFMCTLNGICSAMQCFSCHGECYSEKRCNCQTGMCEGDYCFTEKWSREGGYVIYKGCGKGRPRMGGMDNCEYQRLSDRVFCLCNDENFCNEHGAVVTRQSIPNNTCLHCFGGACTSKCHDGDYCSADFTRNQFTCANGKPLLPFHYQSQELQQNFAKPWPACTTFKAGPVHNVAECACTNPMCNNPSYLRDHMYFDDTDTPLIHCHSCAEEMLTESVLPTCRRQTCAGHFCAIKVESVFDALASAAGSGSSSSGSASSAGSGTSGGSWTKSYRYKQWSGCLNSTRPDQVMKGTFQRWTVATRQVTECVCKKDFCNLDIKACMRASAYDHKSDTMQLWLWLWVLFAIYVLL